MSAPEPTTTSILPTDAGMEAAHAPGTTMPTVANAEAEMLADVPAPAPPSQPRRGTKRPCVEPVEVLLFTDGSEPGEPIMYVKQFSELPTDLQRRMRNKHRSFHDINEEKHDMWKELVCDLVGSMELLAGRRPTTAERAMKAMPFIAWMADPVLRRTPLSVVSSFTWGQC